VCLLIQLSSTRNFSLFLSSSLPFLTLPLLLLFSFSASPHLLAQPTYPLGLFDSLGQSPMIF
jgi:hypothetical protein